MKISERNIGILKTVSVISAVFTLLVALTMIFSLAQLKILDPVNSPAIETLKEQFDREPENRNKAEQVRAIDLMARKAYFSSRWQVETGSYLLLAGALIFVLAQRLISMNDKLLKLQPSPRPDISAERRTGRKYLLTGSLILVVAAIASSFILRSELPAPGSERVSARDTEVAQGAIALMPGDVNYPFFRGEGSRGIAGGTGYPVEWNGNDGTGIKWKIPVPKPGKSSPVIWGSKLFLTGASGGEFEVYCIDKNSGEILWTGSGTDFQGASTEIPESDAEAGMAVSTPALNAEVVCAVFGNGNLVCFDHDGKLKWAKNLGVPQVIYGFTASLLIYENILLVQYDSQDKISILGFDVTTGEQKWETPRTGRSVNSSPVISVFDGVPQVMINGNPNVSSYNPLTGEELWSLPGVSGDVAPSLAVNSKYVYAVTDYYKLIAMKPGKNGSAIWEDNSYTPDVSSPAADEECLYLTTGSGDAACYNAEKGDTLWTYYFEESFYASPIICDGKVWMLDRAGNMHIAEAGKKLKIIGTSPAGEETDSSPAFSEKKVYIRSHNSLYCISKD
jgi:outer membrane protein assembly factor BamB